MLADGRVVRTDETHEPDLFWALRGGGGNFGVVTSLRVRLHPVADVSAGIVAFPWEQARSVFKAYDDLIATIPDELTLTPGFFPNPGGKPTVLMLHAWCGDRREDERVLDQALAVDFVLCDDALNRWPRWLIDYAGRCQILAAHGLRLFGGIMSFSNPTRDTSNSHSAASAAMAATTMIKKS
jgi:hypothetical protein